MIRAGEATDVARSGHLVVDRLGSTVGAVRAAVAA